MKLAGLGKTKEKFQKSLIIIYEKIFGFFIVRAARIVVFMVFGLKELVLRTGLKNVSTGNRTKNEFCNNW